MPRSREPPKTAMQALQEDVRELQNRIRLLERLVQPTKVRRGLLEWLRETKPPVSYLDTIRRQADRGNLLLVLQQQGLPAAMMALWTKVYQPDDPDCPLRTYNIAPQILYGYDGNDWVKITAIEFKTLHQVTEQWFYRAIRAEHGEGTEAATAAMQRILNSSSDTSKLRPRLSTYLRRTLKEVRIYEFEP
jgi:hypothetical protein